MHNHADFVSCRLGLQIQDATRERSEPLSGANSKGMPAFAARDRNRPTNGHWIRKARWRIKTGGMLENQAIAKTGNCASGLVGPGLSGMLKVEKKTKKGRKNTNRRSSQRGKVCVALPGFVFVWTSPASRANQGTSISI